jgi:hypothetical protein
MQHIFPKLNDTDCVFVVVKGCSLPFSLNWLGELDISTLHEPG